MRNDWELKRIQVPAMHGCNYTGNSDASSNGISGVEKGLRVFIAVIRYWCRLFHLFVVRWWIQSATERRRMHASDGEPSANRFRERRKSGANYKLHHWLNVAPYMHRLQHLTQMRVKIIRHWSGVIFRDWSWLFHRMHSIRTSSETRFNRWTAHDLWITWPVTTHVSTLLNFYKFITADFHHYAFLVNSIDFSIHFNFTRIISENRRW